MYIETKHEFREHLLTSIVMMFVLFFVVSKLMEVPFALWISIIGAFVFTHTIVED